MKARPGAIENFGGALGRVGLVYLANFFMGIIFFSSAIPAMAAERDSYYREYTSRMYKSRPYVASFLVAELPYLAFFAVLHVGVLFAFVDFIPGLASFGWYFLFYFLYLTLMACFAQLLVASMPDEGTATSLGVAFLTITVNSCGFAITPDNIPDYWQFMYWLAPIHYVLEGITVTQFHSADLHLVDIPGGPTVARYFTSHWSDSHFGGTFCYSHRWQNVAILLFMIFACRVGTVLALGKINYATK